METVDVPVVGACALKVVDERLDGVQPAECDDVADDHCHLQPVNQRALSQRLGTDLPTNRQSMSIRYF